MLQALTNSCEVDSLAEQSTFILLTELTENVIQHADTTYGGFAAAQALKKQPTFEIGIVEGSHRPGLALRIYRQAMRRSEGEKSALNRLVQGEVVPVSRADMVQRVS